MGWQGPHQALRLLLACFPLVPGGAMVGKVGIPEKTGNEGELGLGEH